MNPLYSVSIPTSSGEKSISVFASDVLAFDEPIDILTVSAFYRSYYPVARTMLNALHRAGISVAELSKAPEIDLRELCNVWLSKPISGVASHIKRIGCVEMLHKALADENGGAVAVDESEMLKSIKAYFHMLDLAADCGIKMDTVAIPMLGSGRQHISTELILIPLINECVQYLKRNSAVKRLFFIEKDQQKAFRAAQALMNSYSINSERQSAPERSDPKPSSGAVAFLSHSSKDRNIADNLCAKLEAKGVQVWYAPRNVRGAYASSIAEAIMRATHFIIILSKNSMSSEHVLNEIDLAFRKLPDKIKFKPLRIDDQEFAPAFEYYLSRQHWLDAYIPPLEQRLNEFVDYFMEDM